MLFCRLRLVRSVLIRKQKTSRASIRLSDHPNFDAIVEQIARQDSFAVGDCFQIRLLVHFVEFTRFKRKVTLKKFDWRLFRIPQSFQCSRSGDNISECKPLLVVVHGDHVQFFVMKLVGDV